LFTASVYTFYSAILTAFRDFFRDGTRWAHTLSSDILVSGNTSQAYDWHMASVGKEMSWPTISTGYFYVASAEACLDNFHGLGPASSSSTNKLRILARNVPSDYQARYAFIW
jgi:hypothetical protein